VKVTEARRERERRGKQFIRCIVPSDRMKSLYRSSFISSALDSLTHTHNLFPYSEKRK